MTLVNEDGAYFFGENIFEELFIIEFLWDIQFFISNNVEMRIFFTTFSLLDNTSKGFGNNLETETDTNKA